MDGKTKAWRFQGPAADVVLALSLESEGGPSFSSVALFLDDLHRAMAATRRAVKRQGVAERADANSRVLRRLGKALRDAQDEEAAIEKRAKQLLDAYILRVVREAGFGAGAPAPVVGPPR